MGSDRIEKNIPNLIKAELDEIGKECEKDNWDSYKAKGIKKETIELAKQIFSDIWIAPINDGSVHLSFHNEQIILQINEDKTLSIFVMSGKDKNYIINLDTKFHYGDY